MGILSVLFGNKAYEGLFKLEINGKENHATIFNMRTEAIVEQFYTRKSGGPYTPGRVTWSDDPVKRAFKWMQSQGKHVLTVNELKTEDVYPSQRFFVSEEEAYKSNYPYIFMLYR